jgi:hypothetical protein
MFIKTNSALRRRMCGPEILILILKTVGVAFKTGISILSMAAFVLAVAAKSGSPFLAFSV